MIIRPYYVDYVDYVDCVFLDELPRAVCFIHERSDSSHILGTIEIDISLLTKEEWTEEKLREQTISAVMELDEYVDDNRDK